MCWNKYSDDLQWKNQGNLVISDISRNRWWSGSGKPGDHWTLVLNEMVLLTLRLQVRNTHIVCTDPYLHELHGPNIKDIEPWRLKNKQILSVVATHFWPALLGLGPRLNAKQSSNRLMCIAHSCGSLKLLMLMDTNLHACGSEANQNSLKWRYRPKNGLRSHQISKKIFIGEHAPWPS